MDELNMANGQPVSQLPPEADSDRVQSPPAQPAAEEARTVDAAPGQGTSPEPPAEKSQVATPQVSAETARESAAEGEATPATEAAPEAPRGEEPKAEEPTAKEPKADKPKAEKRTVAEPAAEEPKVEEPKSDKMDWYILKVQSNREESIREGLLRRVAIANLGYYFGEVIVPTEKVTEFKGGKKKVIKRKLYPGYLVVHMEINDDTWFLVRETPGIGDFTGAAGRPSPMLPHEVDRIVAKQEEKSEKAPRLKIAFREGERVKIKEGTFENFEGEVESIDETNGRVTVMINIFGRSTPVELEYWQIEAL
jgi:transcription termination/antitermination protein NusG